MKAAIYTRVSTSDQNPELQLREIHDFAGRVGKTVHSRPGRISPWAARTKVFNREQVAELRAQGLSYRRIASRLAVGEGTVRRILQARPSATEPRQKPAAEIL